ncbi:hypothetical protein MKK84_06520 [Methylobacterium sp. E-065]|uniref:hypothetical protein n=1 Tax=Methylobacterium sp. E-065 TaxID=2836583 RepID=UPI001FB98C93|nr:hypothetical protein [Methylobacterium sp. E-065]MCJ2017081.1 hypothetical protein [Methylobacterium sp. E-065]
MLYDEMGRLADEALRLNARMVQNAMLLTVAMNYAWTASQHREPRRTRSEIKAHVKRQARTRRPKRRGVPTEVAARGLRIL